MMQPRLLGQLKDQQAPRPLPTRNHNLDWFWDLHSNTCIRLLVSLIYESSSLFSTLFPPVFCLHLHSPSHHGIAKRNRC